MFREIYKTLEIDKRLVVNGRVEFAKDTVFNYNDKEYVKLKTSTFGLAETIEVDEDPIVLVQLTSTEEELEQDCWKVILAAGAGRNLFVFDSDEKNDNLTIRLLGLMQTLHKRNSGKNRLTKFFARKSKLTTDDFRIKGVEDDLWNEIEGYYLNDLGCNLPKDKSNLIIGVSEEEFVTPKVGDKYGVACLSSNNVLLGAF